MTDKMIVIGKTPVVAMKVSVFERNGETEEEKKLRVQEILIRQVAVLLNAGYQSFELTAFLEKKPYLSK